MRFHIKILIALYFRGIQWYSTRFKCLVWCHHFRRSAKVCLQLFWFVCWFVTCHNCQTKQVCSLEKFACTLSISRKNEWKFFQEISRIGLTWHQTHSGTFVGCYVELLNTWFFSYVFCSSSCKHRTDNDSDIYFEKKMSLGKRHRISFTESQFWFC